MRLIVKQGRQQLILEALRDNWQVTVAELSRRFGVSEVTVRRDLDELAARGVLLRAHGGAVIKAPPESPVRQRMNEAREYKEAVGRAAARLVGDGESIFIGSGTTTGCMVRHLWDRKNLTIVTNGINVATDLATAEDVTVVVTGGMMRPSEMSMVGHIAELSLREVRVDKAFMGARAFSLDEGITNDYLPEVVTDRTIMEMAPQVILLADHTKFGKVASAYVAPVEWITTLVTDWETEAEAVTRLRDKGMQVIIAEDMQDKALSCE